MLSKFIISSERSAFRNCQEKKHKKLPTPKLVAYKISKLNQKSMANYFTTKIEAFVLIQQFRNRWYWLNELE